MAEEREVSAAVRLKERAKFSRDAGKVQEDLGNTEEAVEEVGEEAEEASESFIGFKDVVIVSAAAVAAQVVAMSATAVSAFQEIEQAQIDLRTEFGFTEDRIQDLGERASHMAGRFTASAEETAEALGRVRQQTGLTGEAADQLSEMYIRLGEVTDVNLAQVIDDLNPMLDIFNVRLEDQSKAIDMFFRASQRTGQSVTDIIGAVERSAGALSSYGFTIENVVGMHAQFDESGVQPRRMMDSMARSLRQMGDEFESPVEWLQSLQTEITGASTAAEAGNLAQEMGMRASGRIMANLVDAVRDGRLNLTEFTEAGIEGGRHLNDVYHENLTLMDRLGTMWGKIKEQLVPLGEAIIEVAEELLPTLEKWINRALTAFAPQVERAAAWLRDVGIPAVADFSDWVERMWRDYAQPALEALGNWWEESGSGILDSILALSDEVGRFAGALYHLGKEIFEQVVIPPFEQLWDWVMRFTSGTGDAEGSVDDFGSMLDTVSGKIEDFTGWLEDNEETITNVTEKLSYVLIPAFVSLGVQATIAAGKVALSLGLMLAKAVLIGPLIVAQLIKMGVQYSILAVKAGISAAQTAIIWGLMVADAAKAAVRHTIAVGKVIAGWVAMAAKATAKAAVVVAKWTWMAAKAAVQAGKHAVAAGRVVAAWALMGAKSLLHAGKVALAWFIALGPIGWATAAVIGIAALIIWKWEEIRDFTISAFTTARDWFLSIWESLPGPIKGIINRIVSPIRYLVNIGKWLVDEWRNIWGIIKNVFGIAADVLTGNFSNLTNRLGAIWDNLKGLFATPINWVIENVWNNGIRRAWNAVAGLLPGLGEMREIGTIMDPTSSQAQAMARSSSRAAGFGVGLNQGGPVPGVGPDRDSVPATLTPGEWVINRDAVDQMGSAAMRALNEGRANVVGSDELERMIEPPMDQVIIDPHYPTEPIAHQGRGPPTYQQMMEALRSSGIPHRINSTVRTYDYPSLHGTGHAVDVSGPALGQNTMIGAIKRFGRTFGIPSPEFEQGLLRINKWIAANYGANTDELILTAPHSGGAVNLMDGRPHTWNQETQLAHMDHVHWGMKRMIGGGAQGSGGGIMGFLRDRVAGILDSTLSPVKDLISSHLGGDGFSGLLSGISTGLIDKVIEFVRGSADAAEQSAAHVPDGPLRDVMQDLAGQRGWSAGPWAELISRESSWDPTAQNPTSTAYGLGQFLDSTWATVGGSKTSHGPTQLEYMARYIAARYGDPSSALSFHDRNNYYARGGRMIPNVPSVVGDDGPELWLPDSQNRGRVEPDAGRGMRPVTFGEGAVQITVQAPTGEAAAEWLHQHGRELLEEVGDQLSQREARS